MQPLLEDELRANLAKAADIGMLGAMLYGGNYAHWPAETVAELRRLRFPLGLPVMPYPNQKPMPPLRGRSALVRP